MATRLQRLVAVIEPATVIVLGLVVGGIVMSILTAVLKFIAAPSGIQTKVPGVGEEVREELLTFGGITIVVRVSAEDSAEQ